jgi:translation initiation factor IF-2
VAQSKKRIYEVARDFNVSSDAVIKVLKELKHDVKNHMSTVTTEMLESISQRFTQAQAQAKVEDTKRREVQAAIEQHKAEEARAAAVQAAQATVRAKAAEALPRPAPATPMARGNAPAAPATPRPAAPAPASPARGTSPSAPARPSAPPQSARGATSPPSAPTRTPLTPAAGSRPAAPTPRPGTPPPQMQSLGARRHPKGRNKKPQVDQRAVMESFSKTMAELEGPKRRRRRRSQTSGVAVEENENIVQAVEMMPLHDLATELGVRPQELIAKCLKNGVMATMNSRLDKDTIEFLVTDYGYEVEFVSEFDEEETEAEVAAEGEALPRPPVVTIMGHVDHGKTSILDYIRKANVIAGEAGGITQHIGAYEVTTSTGHQITFLDTPGHEAFTAMRARGAQVTDLVVIVVAANDGIMPQTVEAINHARAAAVPFMVAINKVDLPDANPDRVKQQLTQHSIVIEEYGGTTVACEVSAKTGKGIDHLLEMINLQSELLELRAPRAGRARGVVLEARKTAQHGVVVNLLVRTGTLRLGDVFVAGRHAGRVRALLNERGRRVEAVLPGSPVQLLGCDGTPQAGDPLMVVADEREARDIATRRQQYERAREAKAASRVTLEQLYKQIQEGELRELRLILKADVDGSVEALSESLEKLSNKEVGVLVIHRGVGGINDSDVSLAVASNAVVLGFHVRPTPTARELAKREKVDIQLYEIIYEAVESVKKALEGMLEPEQREVIEGMAEVRNTFRVPKAGMIAGCYVTSGSITRNAKVRVIRDQVVVYTSTVGSLRRFKDDVKEVATGFECGVGVAGFDDLKVGDVLEVYRIDKVTRTL